MDRRHRRSWQAVRDQAAMAHNLGRLMVCVKSFGRGPPRGLQKAGEALAGGFVRLRNLP